MRFEKLACFKDDTYIFYISFLNACWMVYCRMKRKNETKGKILVSYFFAELLFLLISECGFACSEN